MSWKNVQYENGKMRTNDSGGGGGSSTFAGLDDVNFTNLANGQIPKYNSQTQKWENANESGGGGTVTDVEVDGQSVVNQQGVAEITIPTINVDDVKVNGTSVVDANKVAQIVSYKEVTQAQYEALPASKTSDGIAYFISDARSSGGNGIDDVLVGGVSVVGQDNIARIPETPTLPYPVFMDGSHHFFASSGTYYSLNNAQYTWFQTGAYPLSVEIYYYALGNTDGYLFCVGNNSSGNDLSISVRRVVTYWGQDWYHSGNEAFGLHHIVVTYDGDKTFQYYRDGVLIGTKSISSAINIQLSGICFGCWIGSTSQETLKGSIFYTRVYDHVLSANDVSNLYVNRGL